MSDYSKKFKDPRWQKKRLEILNRDDWQCSLCNDEKETLHIHHLYYKKNKNPWDYPNDALITLCESCHSSMHEGITTIMKFIADDPAIMRRVIGYIKGVNGEYACETDGSIEELVGWADAHQISYEKSKELYDTKKVTPHKLCLNSLDPSLILYELSIRVEG